VLGGDGGQPSRVRNVVALAGGGRRELLERRAVVQREIPGRGADDHEAVRVAGG
jgi:hypothetical protein